MLGSLVASRSAGIQVEAAAARDALVAPLCAAIESGVADGSFTSTDAAGDADLLAAAGMHAAGLTSRRSPPSRTTKLPSSRFFLRSLGAKR